MTTGYETIDQYEAAARAAQGHELQNIGWMEHGFAVLGMVQLPRKDARGLQVEYVWTQRGQDQTGTLPAGVVERARQALATEQSARAAYHAKREEALQYIGKHNLSSQAGQVHLELFCAEAWTSFQATQKPTRLALRDLGQVAEEAAQLRAMINGLSDRKRRADDQHQAVLAQIETDRLTAQTALARLGIS